jgi:hypothetical protein
LVSRFQLRIEHSELRQQTHNRELVGDGGTSLVNVAYGYEDANHKRTETITDPTISGDGAMVTTTTDT